jgi:hypothetical protein
MASFLSFYSNSFKLILILTLVTHIRFLARIEHNIVFFFASNLKIYSVKIKMNLKLISGDQVLPVDAKYNVI